MYVGRHGSDRFQQLKFSEYRLDCRKSRYHCPIGTDTTLEVAVIVVAAKTVLARIE